MGTRIQWTCRVCGAAANESEAVARRAIIENRMGYYLRKLGWEGEALLDRGGQG